MIGKIVEDKNSYYVTILKPSTHYLEMIFKLRCFPDLLELGLFPNAKEFTESMGCFVAIKKYFSSVYPLNDSKIKVMVVGDGKTPRTGALIAFMSKFTVFSVDPNLEYKPSYVNIKRLEIIPKPVEEVFKKVDIIVLPHAHIYLEQIEHLECENIIALPCCYPQDEFRGRKPDIEYIDRKILSPQRTIKIWKKLTNE